MNFYVSLVRRAMATSAAVVLLTGAVFAGVRADGVGSSAASRPAAALSTAERKAVDNVDVATIRDVTSALSAPDMEGRGTATPGGNRAAAYIADRFKRLGLKPLGDNGSYLQAVPFLSSQILPATSFSAGDAKLQFKKEFIPAPPFTAAEIDGAGDLVFVGYGVASEELKRNDFEGLDLNGKIVVVLNGQPKGVDDAAWKKASNQQALFMNLLPRGVAGVVIVGYGGGEWTFDKIADYLTRRSVSLAGAASPMPMKLPPIVLASTEGAEKIFAGTNATFADVMAKAETGEFVSRDLGKQGNLAIRIERKDVTGSNVIAVLEGSDPSLKSQAVVYTAHYDAFGRAADGRIYAGAADNALGVGEMLAIAAAITKSQPRPRRSIVFLAVTGEEYGLLGAKYFTEHPTWPLDQISLDVNFDGIGTEVYGPVRQLVGFGAEYSTVGPLFDDVVAAMGGRVVPDPMPEEKAFYRSDHYAFVKKGVPALMLLGGPDGDTAMWVKKASEWLQTDYHQPGDVVKADWNWDGAGTVARIGLVVGLRAANSDAMLEWVEGAPFSRPAKAAAAAGGK